MTDIFTATYGTRIRSRGFPHPIEVDDSTFGWQPLKHYVGGSMMDNAMAEWYQHRRDVELGRWRDPEAPDKVVYHLPSAKREATGRTVRVLDERLGATVICNEHLERSSDPTNAEPSAARYFAAHPEPKPWESAEEGEMWLITCGTVYKNAPAIVKDGSFYFPNRYGDGMDFIDLEGVMTATRVFPEPEDE